MYGCTEKCANSLKEKLKGETLLVNAVQGNLPNPKDFQNVILGSSIKIGKIGKKLTSYIQNNKESLKTVRLGLFICSGDQDAEYLKLNFGELYDTALVKENFGGEISMNKVGFMTRLMLKMAGKAKSYSRIDEIKIGKLAAVINS